MQSDSEMKNHSKSESKQEWTDAERMKLCQELDEDLDKHLDSLSKTKAAPLKDRWTEENWKEKIAEHPIFSPFVQNDEAGGVAPVNDLSEGLAQLKYAPEHNSPLEVAQSYKEEGLNHFKFKKYRFAIRSFTEGIKANCEDQQLNSQLLNNRAAAHFHLKNYRSTIKDCQKAVDLNPTYLKAIRRAIECATCIQSWQDVVEWCDKGLKVENNADFLKARSSAVKQIKLSDRDMRKKALDMKKKLEQSTRIVSEIAKRGIQLEKPSSDECPDVEDLQQILLHDLQPYHPSAKESPVHINENEELIWPVLFLYPEYKESDCILEFNENSTFRDHIEEMFSVSASPAPWDPDKKYVPQSIELYYENKSKDSLVLVDTSQTLKVVLSDRRYEVKKGTPAIIVLQKYSAFFKEFVSQYK